MAIIKVSMNNDCRLMEVNGIEIDELVAKVSQSFNLEKGSIDLHLAEDQSKGAKFEVHMKHAETGKEHSNDDQVFPETSIPEDTFMSAAKQLKEVHGLDVTVEDIKILASVLRLKKRRIEKLIRRTSSGTAEGSDAVGSDSDLTPRDQKNSDCSEAPDTNPEVECEYIGPNFCFLGRHSRRGYGPRGHGPLGHGPLGHGPRGRDHDRHGYGRCAPCSCGPFGPHLRGPGPHGLGPHGHGPRGRGPRGHGPRGHGPCSNGPRIHGPRGHGPRGHGPRAAKMKMVVNTLHERGVKIPEPALRQVLHLMQLRPRHVEKTLMN